MAIIYPAVYFEEYDFYGEISTMNETAWQMEMFLRSTKIEREEKLLMITQEKLCIQMISDLWTVLLAFCKMHMK